MDEFQENIIISDTSVQVIFKRSDETRTLQDAINLSREEYDNMSYEQLEALKDERFARWVTAVTSVSYAEPIPAEEPLLDSSVQ